MLTRNGTMKILQRIFETGGLTTDMEKDVQKLKDDFDEREGILRKYGEVYDGEDRDEYEWKEREGERSEYINGGDKKDWEREYNNLKARYMERFFGSVPESTTTEEIVEETPEETADISIDDILYQKEDE